ncbi:MAG: ORC1-type DNA replication protein [archaeon GB-1867-005]|nr:ORC1-type DNA replication protein [Candidatus Culexmicrobium cathedralense]
MSEVIERALAKPSIFKDESKLSIDYVPENLPHREDELETLTSYFRFMIEKPGGLCQKVLIVGPVGTGKTATSKLFGKVFSNLAEKKGVKLKYFHVNCHKDRTLYMVLKRVIKGLMPNFPERGLSAQEMLQAIWDYLESEDSYALLTLDELDYFIRTAGETALYDLIRMSDELLNLPQRFSFIFIARSQVFLPALDKSTRSTLMHNIIRFKPYTASQLKDILKARVEEAFFEGAISDEIISIIADIASETGDARYALELLWRAAKYAEVEESRRVKLEHVRKAASDMHPFMRVEVLENLLLHEKILLLAIARTLKTADTAYVTMGEIEETYKLICEELNERPRKHTQLWEYVQNLKNLGLIKANVTNVKRKGRSTKIGLVEVPIETIEKEVLALIWREKSGRAKQHT